jgi:hypothetical protein
MVRGLSLSVWVVRIAMPTRLATMKTGLPLADPLVTRVKLL